MLAENLTGLARIVRAATVAEAATALGLAFHRGATATLNGELTTGDGQMPLVPGDTVAFRVAGTDG